MLRKLPQGFSFSLITAELNVATASCCVSLVLSCSAWFRCVLLTTTKFADFLAASSLDVFYKKMITHFLLHYFLIIFFINFINIVHIHNVIFLQKKFWFRAVDELDIWQCFNKIFKFYGLGLSFSFSFYPINIMVNNFVRYSIFCICYGVHPTKKRLIHEYLWYLQHLYPVSLNSTRVKLLAPVVWQIIHSFLSKMLIFDLVVSGSSFSTCVAEAEGLPDFRLITYS